MGVIRLDCIASKEKRFKHVIDQQRLHNFIANLTCSRMSDNERLALVIIFAPYHYFTCHQCHEILSSFGMGNEKVQAALLLNFRSATSCTQEAVVPLRSSTCMRICWIMLCSGACAVQWCCAGAALCQGDAVLCYAVMCCAVLCCAVLCCAVLCCAVLCYTACACSGYPLLCFPDHFCILLCTADQWCFQACLSLSILQPV